MRLFIIVLVKVLFFGAPHSLQAAEFSIKEISEPDKYGNVSAKILMQGVIEEGDDLKLSKILSGIENLDFRRKELFLNSPGGSFAAGIQLGEYIRELGVQTHVDSGASCLSACALAFMFGSILDGDDSRGIARTLHYEGILGFHAPFAFTTEPSVPEAARALLITDAERSAREAASLLVSQSVQGVLPSSLIQELLLVEQKDFLFVDTVDRAGRWSIPIRDALPMKELHHERLEEFCTNLWAWERTLAFQERSETDEVQLMSFSETSLGTLMMEFECNLELIYPPGMEHPLVRERDRGQVIAWHAMPGNVALNTLGPEEVVGGAGPTWDERFPLMNETSQIDMQRLKRATGACRDGLVWEGGWNGKDGSNSYDDFDHSYARVSTCGGGFGPMSITCNGGTSELEFRFAYGRHQSPNTDGLVALNIDGETHIVFGENGDVHGHKQVFANLPRENSITEKLKRGNLLKLVGDGPQQVIHLSGSRAAIEAMELSCP